VTIFCRYDFYPELFLGGHSVRLVSGSLKGKKKNFLRRVFFSQFESIVAATDGAREDFLRLGIETEKLLAYDFRHPRILRRVMGAKERLQQAGVLEFLLPQLQEIRRSRVLVLGSFWPSEIGLFDPQMINEIKNGEVLVLIAPHKLDRHSLDECQGVLSELLGEDRVYVIPRMAGDPQAMVTGFQAKPGIVFIERPGILCELYSLGGAAFVGGGHGRSVHSVLEPFWAGATVYCGPKTHRSSEVDFICENSPQSLHVVGQCEEFAGLWRTCRDQTVSQNVEAMSQESLKGLDQALKHVLKL
jgi:3-deoxy-D-manno-octulosonic-acid transferase